MTSMTELRHSGFRGQAGSNCPPNGRHSIESVEKRHSEGCFFATEETSGNRSELPGKALLHRRANDGVFPGRFVTASHDSQLQTSGEPAVEWSNNGK
jgi:hypothetical protein